VIDAKVSGENLAIELTGADCWPYCLRAQVTIQVPLEQIVKVSTGRPKPAGSRRHVNFPARPRGDRHGVLVWVRRGGPTLGIECDGGPYRWITLSVPDPERTEKEIRSAVPRRLE
jgi:hypothetical protein